MGTAKDELRDRYDVVVIGAGQAGLATGYYLAKRGCDFVILDAAGEVGGTWRDRWDSLRLFTAARYDGLPGLPFPGPSSSYPTKDEVADYLASYAVRFGLPIQMRTRVDTVSRAADGMGFAVWVGRRPIDADNVVVATGAWREPLVPDFASELDPAISQLHSSAYLRPAQLQPGPVLVVGASNSGAEVALEVARTHPTTLVGRDTGQLPADLDGWVARVIDPVIWFAANHVLTVDNPIGRKGRLRERFHGEPVERARPRRLRAAGVDRRYGRVIGSRDGLPQLDDGQVVDATNVIWATGYKRDFSWIDLPIFGDDGWPDEDHGVVAGAPGVYFIGLPFQRSMASALLGGVGRDAGDLVEHLVSRVPRTDPAGRDRGSVAASGRA